MDKRFRIVDGENYWSKYERFVELYNDHTLSVDEVHKKLEISKNKLNAYRKRGFDEDRLIKRDHRRKGMTEKRFYVAESNLSDGYCVFDREKKYAFHPRPRKADCLNDAYTLNELHEENIRLKSENNMLRNTIGRNEAYIGRLTHKGQWKTTSDETDVG